jgi:hypothetical protein
MSALQSNGLFNRLNWGEYLFSMLSDGIDEVSAMRSTIITGLLAIGVLALSPLVSTALPSNTVYSGVSTKGNLSVWRISRDNGAVSLCSFDGHINEPVCYPPSEGSKGGKFSVVFGDDVLSTWRINDATGAVSFCEYKAVSEPPICTPWSSK